MTTLMSGAFSLLVFLPVVAIGAFLPVLIYLVARWRNRTENAQPDGQIGLKVALHLFRVVGFQLSLLAAFVLLLGIISEAPTADFIRIAIGLGVPAVAIWFLHIQLIGRTNDSMFPAVGRMFNGWNLIVTALPGMVGVIAFSIVIVAPGLGGDRIDILRAVVPYMAVYGGAWALLGLHWFRAAGLIDTVAPGAGSVGPAARPPESGSGQL